MPRAVLFDMDRTLVRIDTATLYTRYERRRGEASFGDVARVAWWLLQYSLGVIDAPKVARRALGAYVGKRERWLVEHCERWFESDVLPHVCRAGRESVRRHLAEGELVAIVTSATPYAAGPLAKELGIEHVVCTELEVEDGRFTGEIVEPLCYGRGKLEKLAALADEHGFDVADATFYSDSITDLPLLERVREPICVNPDTRLRRVASRRKWRVEHW